MQYVDAKGNAVTEGDPRAAYQVNPDDPAAGEFVERLRRAAGATGIAPAATPEAATPEAAVAETPEAATPEAAVAETPVAKKAARRKRPAKS